MGTKDLTLCQRRVFDFIADCLRADGRPPTVREIGEKFSLRSTGSVRSYLEALEKKGYIARQASISRGITVLEQARPAAPKRRKTRRVPVVGRVAAGPPILAVEDVEEVLEFDEELVPSGGELFALRVNGDSMINAGIHDGDYVFVRRQQAADRGDIIVAIVDGEATVKIYQPSNGKILLVPANDALSPTTINPGESDFLIVGKVTGMMRRF